MKIIKPSVEILRYTEDLTKILELGGRTCYKSEGLICDGSDTKFIEKLKTFKHESVLEHGSITVRFITDRGVMAELTRHRIAAFSVESTRYCNYGKDKFGNDITVIEPHFWENDAVMLPIWVNACEYAEKQYMNLLKTGASAQEARSVLPNSLKTEIVMSANPREWRHVMATRSHRDAHPQIRQIMCPLLIEFRKMWPVLFDDVGNIEHPSPAEIISND
jgi:thymidylate synthase (FAD)